MSSRVLVALLASAFATVAAAQEIPPAGDPNAPVMERLTFDEAVRRALERNPTVGEATQAILRAEALLDEARTVFHPSLDGVVGTTVLDAPRGFDGQHHPAPHADGLRRRHLLPVARPRALGGEDAGRGPGGRRAHLGRGRPHARSALPPPRPTWR